MFIYMIVVALIIYFESHLAVGVTLKTAKCSALNGICQDDSEKCAGSYISNYCNDHGPTVRCCTKTPIVRDISNCSNKLKIISRDSWGARRQKESIPSIDKTLQQLFIHHGASSPCQTKTECMRKIRDYQNHHQDTNDWEDIGYSFLVGEDGYIYEGRGWRKYGSHTYGYNGVSIGLCFIGNFTGTKPNDAALETAKRFIECAKDSGYLSANFSLYGHRDVSCSTCPGEMLYKEIEKWGNFHCFAGETLKTYCRGKRSEDNTIDKASSNCK